MLTIKITEEDIINARSSYSSILSIPYTCPIAMAAKRITGQSASAGLGELILRDLHTGVLRLFKLSTEARKIMHQWDLYRTAVPSTVTAEEVHREIPDC